MTTERVALMLEPTETLCGRCECVIRNVEEAFILDAERNAPYLPLLLCSEECKQQETEDRFEHAYEVQS